MIISIQVSQAGKEWDECPAVAHEVNTWEEGVLIAKAIGKQLNVVNVRLTKPFPEFVGKPDFQRHVGNCNGTYIRIQ